MPLAYQVMDSVAALLNDANRTLFTYDVQLPYLRSAWNELQLVLQQHGVPVAKEISLELNVPANTASIASPSDLIQPIKLEERGDYFTEVEEVTEIPDVESSRILYWLWREETIYINPPTSDRIVRITYWKTLNPLNDQNSNLNVINSHEFLSYRTAALCARYVGENYQRADMLDGAANYHRDILLALEARKMLPVRPKARRWR